MLLPLIINPSSVGFATKVFSSKCKCGYENHTMHQALGKCEACGKDLPVDEQLSNECTADSTINKQNGS